MKWNNVQVETDTYSLLNLALVGLDLVLEFVDHVGKTVLGLAVLLTLEGQLLKAAVLFAQVLLGLTVAALFVVEFNLEFTYLE